MIKTHMPFILNEEIVFCCFGFKELMIGYNYLWKVGYFNFNRPNEIFLIDTKIPKESINCSPYVTYKNGEYTLSFTSSNDAFNYFNMHIFKGEDINCLKETEIVDNIKYGFKENDSYFYISNNYLCINSIIIIYFLNNAVVLKLNKCHLGILVTIDHIEYGLYELLLNNNNEIKILKLKNLNFSPYKSHIYNNLLAYADKNGNLDDREIKFTHDFYFENLPEELAKDIEIVNDWNAYL